MYVHVYRTNKSFTVSYHCKLVLLWFFFLCVNFIYHLYITDIHCISIQYQGMRCEKGFYLLLNSIALRTILLSPLDIDLFH